MPSHGDEIIEISGRNLVLTAAGWVLALAIAPTLLLSGFLVIRATPAVDLFAITPMTSWVWLLCTTLLPTLLYVSWVSTRRIGRNLFLKVRWPSTDPPRHAGRVPDPSLMASAQASRSSRVVDVTRSADENERGYRSASFIRSLAISLALAVLCAVASLAPLAWLDQPLGPWWVVCGVGAVLAFAAFTLWAIQDEMDFARNAMPTPYVLPPTDRAGAMESLGLGLQLGFQGMDLLVRLGIVATAGLGAVGGWGLLDWGQPRWLLMIVWACLMLVLVDPLQRLFARTARGTLESASEVQEEPFILYLRSFDEDRLTIPFEGVRAFHYQVASPIPSYRFEELVTAAFPEVPLMAVSPPGERLVPVGAARLKFSNATWAMEVEELLAKCHAVLLSATPSSVEAGLAQELEMIAHQPLSGPRVALILGPWPPSERVRRFRTFCSAVKEVPYFRGVDAFDPATTLIIYKHGTRWQGLRADRADDGTYVEALGTWWSTARR